MAWDKPQFTRGQVDTAGRSLVREPLLQVAHDDAILIINNWRASHAYPLQCLKMVLWQRAKLVDANALIAQRLKRLPSIHAKLERFKHMQLSQMQDIGGCRAVVGTARHVEQLVNLYESSSSKHQRIERYDYIKNPKT